MTILLYSRRGCHLCEQAEEWLAFHVPDAAVVDVDAEPGLAARYGMRVPVLEADGRVLLEGRFDEARFLAVIGRDSGPGGTTRR